MSIDNHIPIFFNNLIKTKRIKTLISMCENECHFLNQKYNSSIGSLKNAFTKYRNYAKQHIVNDKIINKTNVLNVVLGILKLSLEQQKIFNDDKDKQILRDMGYQREIYNVDKYIAHAVKLLDTSNPNQLIIGLAALTGRRIAEIACTAEFKPTDLFYVLFKGQLKLKTRNEYVYKIPVLHTSDIICEALTKLRNIKPEYTTWVPEEFHNRQSRALNKPYENLFQGYYEPPYKPKDMRSIYAEICCKLYKDQRMAKNLYFSNILGHSEGDINTANSYNDFYIKQ